MSSSLIRFREARLPFGKELVGNCLPELTTRTVHLCVDMQRLFGPEGPWPTPWMARVLPQCVALVERHPQATIFTRFITPSTMDHAVGAWRDFYDRWPYTTRDRLQADLLELVPELARYAPPAHVFDKPVYSAFASRRLLAHLRDRSADTVILSGAETDVCVLSTALSAVDHGFKVVIATDAVCSYSDVGHDALLGLFRARFSQQIAVAPTSEILDRWRAV
ncbi:MAG TPA: cysteine hydrolase [Bosea sp. (in: a-proteobacteria)]|uniref:cysteine hydrolase family protein n=1 Tax=Bosea sp. (in: a-proteobacteria) TaxID=1871050 RepID=UPI002E0FD5E7|nr:cysteine hydrolase [Bosea sp. (in: a-proteobacteria)]